MAMEKDRPHDEAPAGLPGTAAYLDNPRAPWDRLFSGWREAMVAEDEARLRRHIERLRAAVNQGRGEIPSPPLYERPNAAD